MLLQASPDTANPARARGLKRARESRAPCEPAAWTPLPDPVDAVNLLALLTRVRAGRDTAGELSPERLYDVRAFKSAYAELGYLRTLVRRETGGTIVTSMPQLVQGLARLHPAWKIEGDKFADRDRHHSAVRRRLRDLHAMGLLSWRVGVDLDEEDARTELELRPAPDISDQELAAAKARLERWQARYGPALNTGSRTGIRNAAAHGRPLSASERQRRAIARGRARTNSRRAPSITITAPHFVAPPTSENTIEGNHVVPNSNVCGTETRVTRAHESDDSNAMAASKDQGKNASMTEGGSAPAQAERPWDEAALLERVAARERQREPVLKLIAEHATRRTSEVSTWGLDRAWPSGRLREAWVCARYGARAAAEWGTGAAGRLEHDDYTRLRRAVARYERNAAARPVGFPAGGLAGLLYLGRLAASGEGGPRMLAYAIGALDQLSRRMRAVCTDGDQARVQRAVRLAHQRRDPAPPSSPIAFRLTPSRWPRWARLDDAGQPLLVDGELVVDDGWAPARNSDEYRTVLRDAYLLTNGWLPGHVDGRAAMADNTARLTHARRGHATPGPYLAPQRRPTVERDVLELAKRAGLTLEQAQRVQPEVRAGLLAQLRRRDAETVRRDAAALRQRLADLPALHSPGTDDASLP